MKDQTCHTKPTLKTLSKQMKPILHIQPGSDLHKKINMIHLTEKDLAIAQVLQPTIEKSIHEIVESFYSNLKNHSMLLKLIQKHGSFARHKVALRHHIIEMFSGIINDHFIKKRKRIANTHVNIGLPQEWYVLSFEQIYRSILQVIQKVYQDKNDLMLAAKVVNKLIYLETQVVLKAFHKELDRLKEKERRTQCELERMAYYDEITNLPKRNRFKENTKKLIIEADLYEKKVALMHLSIDYTRLLRVSSPQTKKLLLIAISKRLQQSLTDCSFEIGRLDGVEFAIAFTYNTKREFTEIIERMIQAMKHPLQFANREIYLTSHIGIALYPDHCTPIEDLMRYANMAMAEQRKRKRIGYLIFSSTLKKQIKERTYLEDALRKAIRFNQLELVYQPQFNAFTNKLIGLEALIRWNHPKKGMISPGDFIPIAEETGIIYDISKWVIQEACQTLKQWHEQGLSKVPVWVNLSPLLFYEPQLTENVGKILEKVALEPKYLGLEITESAMMDSNVTESTLNKLNDMGVQLSLDDFGTGYSSLSYLHRLPVHGLKIDRSFIMNMMENESNLAIVASIITLAKQLSLEIIAEGVETKEQLNYLLNMKCHKIQGFYFSRPLSKKALESRFLTSV